MSCRRVKSHAVFIYKLTSPSGFTYVDTTRTDAFESMERFTSDATVGSDPMIHNSVDEETIVI